MQNYTKNIASITEDSLLGNFSDETTLKEEMYIILC